MTAPSAKRVQQPPATLADVARQAGVSAMTVSRVVNGEGAVKASTRDRVMAAVAELKYMSGHVARRLVDVDPVRIGVLYSNPSAGYLSEFLVGLINEATGARAQLVVEWVDPQSGMAGVDAFLASGIDAVVMAPPLSDAAALIERVMAVPLAAVLVAPARPDERLSALRVDHHGAALKMTQHLVSLGHERIGFIAGSVTHSAAECRLAGFRDGMRQAGLATPEELVVRGAFTYASGLEAAQALLTQTPRPTAVFAGNDDMAAATVAMAHQLGIDVPGDLTVVGCDDTPIATTICPELTTIRQPIRKMAANAIRMVVRQVHALRAGEDWQPEVVSMDCEIVRRQTDAAPRKRTARRASAKMSA